MSDDQHPFFTHYERPPADGPPLVIAFDRDRTVDTNPPASKQAVPIEWVRHLASETEAVVYATGNQDLKLEADIPGIREIMRAHPTTEAPGEDDDNYFPRRPGRRERVAMLADLYPDATEYVVVDDADLSDLPGWTHYLPWDFVTSPMADRFDLHDVAAPE